MFYFLLQRQKDFGQPFFIHLQDPETVVGRNTVASVRHYPQISRSHAQLTKTPQQTLFIRDLGSVNGTFVNGRRIGKGPHPLNIGDIIGFGDSGFADNVDGFSCVVCANPHLPCRVKQEEVELVELLSDEEEEQQGCQNENPEQQASESSPSPSSSDRPVVDRGEVLQDLLRDKPKSKKRIYDYASASHYESESSSEIEFSDSSCCEEELAVPQSGEEDHLQEKLSSLKPVDAGVQSGGDVFDANATFQLGPVLSLTEKAGLNSVLNDTLVGDAAVVPLKSKKTFALRRIDDDDECEAPNPSAIHKVQNPSVVARGIPKPVDVALDILVPNPSVAHKVPNPIDVALEVLNRTLFAQRKVSNSNSVACKAPNPTVAVSQIEPKEFMPNENVSKLVIDAGIKLNTASSVFPTRIKNETTEDATGTSISTNVESGNFYPNLSVKKETPESISDASKQVVVPFTKTSEIINNEILNLCPSVIANTTIKSEPQTMVSNNVLALGDLNYNSEKVSGSTFAINNKDSDRHVSDISKVHVKIEETSKSVEDLVVVHSKPECLKTSTFGVGKNHLNRNISITKKRIKSETNESSDDDVLIIDETENAPEENLKKKNSVSAKNDKISNGISTEICTPKPLQSTRNLNVIEKVVDTSSTKPQVLNIGVNHEKIAPLLKEKSTTVSSPVNGVRNSETFQAVNRDEGRVSKGKIKAKVNEKVNTNTTSNLNTRSTKSGVKILPKELKSTGNQIAQDDDTHQSNDKNNHERVSKRESDFIKNSKRQKLELIATDLSSVDDSVKSRAKNEKNNKNRSEKHHSEKSRDGKNLNEKSHNRKSHSEKSHNGKNHNGKDHNGKDHNGKDHKEKDHKEKDHKEKDHKEKDHKEKDHKEKDHKEKDHKEKDHKEKDHNESKVKCRRTCSRFRTCVSECSSGTSTNLSVEKIESRDKKKNETKSDTRSKKISEENAHHKDSMIPRNVVSDVNSLKPMPKKTAALASPCQTGKVQKPSDQLKRRASLVLEQPSEFEPISKQIDKGTSGSKESFKNKEALLRPQNIQDLCQMAPPTEVVSVDGMKSVSGQRATDRCEKSVDKHHAPSISDNGSRIYFSPAETVAVSVPNPISKKIISKVAHIKPLMQLPPANLIDPSMNTNREDEINEASRPVATASHFHPPTAADGIRRVVPLLPYLDRSQTMPQASNLNCTFSRTNTLPENHQMSAARFQIFHSMPGRFVPGTANQPKGASKIDSELMLLKVIHWNVSWLEEQVNISKPPPQVSEGAAPLALCYDSVESYKSAFIPMLLLETWEDLFRRWKATVRVNCSGTKFYFNVLSCESWTDTMEISCESIVNPLSATPMEGSVAIVEIAKSNHERSRVFGYITKHKVEPLVFESLSHTWRTFPTQFFYDATLWKFSIKARKKDIFPQGQILTAHLLCPINRNLHLADGLSALAYSKLAKDILQPAKGTFYPYVSNTNRTIFLRPYSFHQSKVIFSVGDEINDFPGQPKITLVHGAPGTGKTQTIIGLVKYLLTSTTGNLRKILILAPTNSIVDVIANRLMLLERDPVMPKFQFVRVGVDRSIQADIQPYSLTKLAVAAFEREKENPSFIEQKLQNLETEIAILTNQIAKIPITNVHHLNVEKSKLLSLEKQCICLRRSAVYRNRPWTSTEERDFKIKVLRNADVILSTVTSCRHPLMEVSFDREEMAFSCCIVDEATQVTELDTLQPLIFGISKLVLFGNREQIPPIIHSNFARDCNFLQSLFERFHLYFLNHWPESPMHLLMDQFRMHSEIGQFQSSYFYDNSLVFSPNLDLAYYNDFPLHPYVVLDVCSQLLNPTETYIIERICSDVLSKLPTTCTVGLVLPSQEEVDFYVKNLPPRYADLLEVNTEVGLQGREKDVVVVVCCSAVSSHAGFLSCGRRLHIAVSRARRCLIVCGNMNSLSHYDVWAALITDARYRGLYATIASMNDVPFVLNKIVKNHQSSLWVNIANNFTCDGRRTVRRPRKAFFNKRFRKKKKCLTVPVMLGST